MYARTQLRDDTSTTRRRKGVSAVRRRGAKSPSGVRSTIRRIAPIVTIPRASESEEPSCEEAQEEEEEGRREGPSDVPRFQARAVFGQRRCRDAGTLSDRARVDRPTSFYQSFALPNRHLLRDSRDVLDPQPSSPTAAPKAARTIIVAPLSRLLWK